MSNFTDFFPAAGGGGLTPKFEEFNSSGTFTPTQALIDAGGYIEIFLVGGGGRGGASSTPGQGGEVLIKKMYLTSTTGCSITIGGGATSDNSFGSSSTFSGSSAGGSDLTAVGGSGNTNPQEKLSPGWGSPTGAAAGNGVFGYGGGSSGGTAAGFGQAKANSGQGGRSSVNGGSGYCLIKWYE